MKKLSFIIFAAAAASVLTVLIAKADKSSPIPASPPVAASSISERMDYFASHGWEVEEIGEKTITIPADFSEIYEEYAAIQDKQGLPLREYAGKNAKLYVYRVKNYSPESRNMLAELLVCDDTAVASMVYSEDGGKLKMSVS